MSRSYRSGKSRAPEDPSKKGSKKSKSQSAEKSVKDMQKNPTHRAPGKGSDVWDEGVKKIKKAFGIK